MDEKERGKKLGHFVIKKLIETSKLKRFYIFCHKELENYYLKLGFDNLHQPPKELGYFAKKYKKDVGGEPLFMAYQKKKKDFSFEAKPDLIVIDGGKGQLHAAHDVIFEKGLNIPMISLAKQLEEVFIPGKSEPMNIASNSDASYLLQRIRDEAHRFAIEFNRREASQVALEQIAGEKIAQRIKETL